MSPYETLPSTSLHFTSGREPNQPPQAASANISVASADAASGDYASLFEALPTTSLQLRPRAKDPPQAASAVKPLHRSFDCLRMPTYVCTHVYLYIYIYIYIYLYMMLASTRDSLRPRHSLSSEIDGSHGLTATCSCVALLHVASDCAKPRVPAPTFSTGFPLGGGRLNPQPTISGPIS